jgi:uncharacterized protein
MRFRQGFLFGRGALFALAATPLIIGNTTAQNTPQGINTSQYSGSITVTGNGYVYADPDLAKVTIGVTTEATTSSKAMSDNAGAMASVVAAIKRLGIPDEDIKTSTVSLQPKYEYQYPTAAMAPGATGIDKAVPPTPTSPPPTSLSTRIVGYTAVNIVTVTARDMSLVGKVIDGSYNGGANNINGVTFLLSDENGAAVYKEALKQAVTDAKDKANLLATAAGITDIKPKTIAENGKYIPLAYDVMERGAGVNVASVAPTPISSRQNKVTATVGLTYVYVPQ